MKLVQLRYFQAVCRCGNNVTRASEELHVTQPCISNAIRELEEEFGVPLFHRLNKRLTLTKEGEIALARVGEILDGANLLSQQMGDLSRKSSHIKLGVPTMTNVIVLPTLLKEFREMHPDIGIEILEYPSRDLVNYIESDLLDVAILNSNSVNISQFDSFHMMDTELVFCTSVENPLAGLDSVTYEDVAEEPLVLMKTDNRINEGIARRFLRHGITPNVYFYTVQMLSIKEFISNNLASSFLFREVIKPEDRIATISLNPKDQVSIDLILRKKRYISKDVARFVEFARSYKLDA